MTKQRTTEWAYIVNVVFRIIKIMMNKDTFIGFRVSNRPSCPHLDPPLVLRELYCSVGTKRVLSKTEKVSAFKSVFVPILTCGHEP